MSLHPVKRRATFLKMSTMPNKFVDIGANLFDERFTQGEYHGKIRHEPDLERVIQRAAAETGVKHMILTAGTLEDSREAVEKVRELRTKSASCGLYCTVGVHPTRCNEFIASPNEHLQELLKIAHDGMRDKTVVAVGEMGLDYDRLDFCSKEVQQEYFEQQLLLSQKTKLPLFLHNRNASTDVYDILARNRDKWEKGVVHSFDDSIELARRFIDLGDLYIGLNGCSLKTTENLEVVRQLPLERILLETDSPYCEIKRTHAGYPSVKTTFPTKPDKKYLPDHCVKGRNEPCHIVQVAEAIAGARGCPVQEVVHACYENSLRLYGWQE